MFSLKWYDIIHFLPQIYQPSPCMLRETVANKKIKTQHYLILSPGRVSPYPLLEGYGVLHWNVDQKDSTSWNVGNVSNEISIGARKKFVGFLVRPS